MAHVLSEAFLAKIKNTRCEQLLTFVKVYWGDGPIVYSEQEVLFDIQESQYSFPALLALGSFDTSLKLNNNGTALNFSITLDDSDGHLRLRFNREILNGTRVDLYLNFDGLNIEDAMLLGVGTINSDTINWEEGKRTLNFGVENVLVSKSVAYKAYPEMVPNQEESFSNNYFPFVFGSPKRIKALRIFGGRKATTTHSREFNGVPDAVPPSSTSKAYVLTSITGYELDTVYEIQFYDFAELDQPAQGEDLSTGQIHKIFDKSFLFVSEGVVDETADVNLLPFDMTDGDAPDQTTFEAILHWWVDVNPAVTDLTDQYLDFEDFNGRPSLFAYKVISHVDIGGKYKIELSHMPRWGPREQERDASLGNSFKEWWSDISVTDVTGTFPDGIKVRARANYVKHSWNVNFLNYTQVERDGNLLDETTGIREQTPVIDPSGQPSLFGSIDTDPLNSAIKTYTTQWLPEDKDVTLNTTTNFIWQLKDATGYNLNKDDLTLVSNNTIHEALLVPSDRDNLSKYVTNIFTSGIAREDPEDIEVNAKSSIITELIPVDNAGLEILHENIIPFELQKVTTLEIDPPLEYSRFQGFYSGDVYVDHTSAYLVHDGVGGTIDLDTENAVDVIEWLMKVYTNLQVFTSQEDFLDIRSKISKQKMAFAVAQEVDAIALANIIAWEHKLALVFFANSVRIIDLNKEPEKPFEFTTSNIGLQSIKLGFVPSNDIVTDFRFRFKSDKQDGVGDVLIFNNNISRYGKNTQFIDVLTLDNEDDVFELAKFWGNRLSRAWRIIEFDTSVEALQLQPYDPVTFDIPVLSTNLITGFVNSIRYEPNSFTVTIKCTLASEASDTLSNSQPVTDSSYWLGLEDLKLEGDKRVGIVSDLDGAKVQKFSLTDLNTLKPFERRL